MPRVTRKSLVDSPEPTRRSSRAATQASSTSSKATPPPSRSRSKSAKKAGSEAGDAPEEVEEIKKPAGRGRSQSRKTVEEVESPAPRGTKRKAPSASPRKARGKAAAKRGKVEVDPEEDVEPDEEEAEEEIVTEEPVEEPEPEKSKGRSRSRGKAAASPKVSTKVQDKPEVSPSSSRARKGKTTPAVTPSPVKSSPRSQRGRKSDVADVEKPEVKASPEVKTTPVKASSAKTTPVKASPAKTTPVKASPAKVAQAEASPAQAEASPVKAGRSIVPVIEPITPESEPETTIANPAVTIAAEADQTSSVGTKRKARDDDVDDVSAKRPHVSSVGETNEAVPAKKGEVVTPKVAQTPSLPSQSTKVTSQSSEAEAKPDPAEDFEIISHSDVPAANSQEVQRSVPANQNRSTKVMPEVTTSEAVSSQTVASSSQNVKRASSEGFVSSQSESVKSSTDCVATVDSSVDIGCYGDDITPVPPQPSTAKTNVTSQSSTVNHRVPDSNLNEAASNQNSANSNTSQSVTQSNQSENVTSSNATNGVSHLEKPRVSPVKHFDPKPTPTSAFLTKYSKDIFNRNFLTNPALSSPVDPARQFSLVSYNILADCHLRRGNYSYTSDQYLNQNYRHELLLRELKYLNADVICLQEVNPEYFTAILKPALQGLGYSGDLYKRCKEYFNEGEATFYKTNRFNLLEQKGLNLKDLAEREVMAGGLNEDVQTAVRDYLDQADVLHLSRLQCKNTGKIVTIGNIHVIWDQFKSPDVQCIQVASAIKEIVNKAGNDTSPFIITGDFNSEITSPAYQLGRDGYLSDTNIQKLQSLENLQTTEGSKSLVNHLWRAFQHTASNLRSAYFTVQGQEPVVTSYTSSMKTAVDYIFYNANSLDVNGTLQVVHHDVINKTGGLPSAEFPSDHVSLKAVFNLKP